MASGFREFIGAIGFEPAYAQLGKPALSERKRVGLLGDMQAGNLVKRTRANRYPELDKLTLEWINRRFPNGQRVAIHDVAASDGITSVELFRLVSASRDLTLRSSDYYDALKWVRMGGFDFIFDADDKPLQMGRGGIGVSARYGPLSVILRPLWGMATRKLSGAKRLALQHPDALTLAAADPRFTLVRESFYEPAPGPYHVVRVMNAVYPNLGEDGTRRVLEAMRGTIVDGGMLVIGRRYNFSLFGLNDGRFTELAHLGEDNSELLRIVRALEGSSEPFWLDESWNFNRKGALRKLGPKPTRM